MRAWTTVRPLSIISKMYPRAPLLALQTQVRAGTNASIAVVCVGDEPLSGRPHAYQPNAAAAAARRTTVTATRRRLPRDPRVSGVATGSSTSIRGYGGGSTRLPVAWLAGRATVSGERPREGGRSSRARCAASGSETRMSSGLVWSRSPKGDFEVTESEGSAHGRWRVTVTPHSALPARPCDPLNQSFLRV